MLHNSSKRAVWQRKWHKHLLAKRSCQQKACQWRMVTIARWVEPRLMHAKHVDSETKTVHSVMKNSPFGYEIMHSLSFILSVLLLLILNALLCSATNILRCTYSRPLQRNSEKGFGSCTCARCRTKKLFEVSKSCKQGAWK